jgi:hypothetical protein
MVNHALRPRTGLVGLLGLVLVAGASAGCSSHAALGASAFATVSTTVSTNEVTGSAPVAMPHPTNAPCAMPSVADFSGRFEAHNVVVLDVQLGLAVPVPAQTYTDGTVAPREEFDVSAGAVLDTWWGQLGGDFALTAYDLTPSTEYILVMLRADDGVTSQSGRPDYYVSDGYLGAFSVAADRTVSQTCPNVEDPSHPLTASGGPIPLTGFKAAMIAAFTANTSASPQPSPS